MGSHNSLPLSVKTNTLLLDIPSTCARPAFELCCSLLSINFGQTCTLNTAGFL
jgi:hypothetical protein